MRRRSAGVGAVLAASQRSVERRQRPGPAPGRLLEAVAMGRMANGEMARRRVAAVERMRRTGGRRGNGLGLWLGGLEGAEGAVRCVVGGVGVVERTVVGRGAVEEDVDEGSSSRGGGPVMADAQRWQSQSLAVVCF
ncbi:hypothetical protein EJ04DRAFT_234890 [Polyplosphaeria fusca]|uniref:Uncharacterized protein n=1 Tax=Polyplosphaeria fusca TaxID=682080 RepID=A0A9P4V8C2_9PLEO|nr:hypothetical protein EJ04DRAFT_234890 [Polyplosphaeria fusca]